MVAVPAFCFERIVALLLCKATCKSIPPQNAMFMHSPAYREKKEPYCFVIQFLLTQVDGRIPWLLLRLPFRLFSISILSVPCSMQYLVLCWLSACANQSLTSGSILFVIRFSYNKKSDAVFCIGVKNSAFLCANGSRHSNLAFFQNIFVAMYSLRCTLLLLPSL